MKHLVHYNQPVIRSRHFFESPIAEMPGNGSLPSRRIAGGASAAIRNFPCLTAFLAEANFRVAPSLIPPALRSA
ncbi:MAG: hypothetical protein JO323_14670 [Acidobacteriia bacterium]|nr:hypothetical protein [Terriglobia bacterium]